MKAICIKNEDETGFNHYMKIGGIYEIEVWGNLGKCEVIDDYGKRHITPTNWFQPIDEYRKEQIEKILECTTSSV